MQTPWEHRFAQRTQRMSSSAIRELLVEIAGGRCDQHSDGAQGPTLL